jgi:CheY-like chemotaxis protein
MRRMASVLIVEDEAALRRNLALYLARRGHSVAEADGVESAIEALEAFASPFDVILLDINLPDGTGWDVLRYLSTRTGGSPTTPATRQSRVIVMTAVRPVQCRLDEFRPAAFLLKPFPMDALVRLLDRVLARRPPAATTDPAGQGSAQLRGEQRRGGGAQAVPVATISREGLARPRTGEMSALQMQNQPGYVDDEPQDDSELDVEDMFGDHDIEYWVRKGHKLVPATNDEIAQIHEWERESVALARLALWQRRRGFPRSVVARLLRGVTWAEKRLGHSRRPMRADHGQAQDQDQDQELRWRVPHGSAEAGGYD